MLKIIDLFSGIGGIRKGFELACADRGVKPNCVFTSEIKPYALDILKQNNPGEDVHGDITQINSDDIPGFDILLAGFPCQAFSVAGKRLGFEDTRGTLFFEVLRILRDKKPFGFILENVEGLVTHDKANKRDKIGKTLTVILESLAELKYKVSWKVLNAVEFGVPQDRKRVYIVGTKTLKPDLNNFVQRKSRLADLLESGLPAFDSNFVRLVLKHYKTDELYGKSVKDKRGGKNNIHSWDIEYRGGVSQKQRELMNLILKERRKKKWAAEYGIDWMDGMPLTAGHIRTFYDGGDLENMLADLVQKGYLKLERPKKKVGGIRVQDKSLPLGYNIVTGKMSFEINKVLDPNGIAPTLVAMDMRRLFVVDGAGLRPLSLREGLRLFGYPDDFKFETTTEYGCDLLGNTVVVPVIKAVADRLLDCWNCET
ncbi:cytosine-specific methyltransferase [Clostridia bacterium]|nr:cytosine-specific methyltransferase [Clostridia bacterium]